MYSIFVVCFIASLICVWSFSQCSHIYYSGIKSKTCSSCQTSNLHSLQFFPLLGHSVDNFSSCPTFCSWIWNDTLWISSFILLTTFIAVLTLSRDSGLLGQSPSVSFGHSGFFKEPQGTGEKLIWLLQDWCTRAPFIGGEKQWILCAEELITRCICVLFSAQRL